MFAKLFRLPFTWIIKLTFQHLETPMVKLLQWIDKDNISGLDFGFAKKLDDFRTISTKWKFQGELGFYTLLAHKLESWC